MSHPPIIAFSAPVSQIRAYMGGVERGQRNVGVVNLYRIARALDMSLSELFAEVRARRGRRTGSGAGSPRIPAAGGRTRLAFSEVRILDQAGVRTFGPRLK
jgi:transcriptional regulator with XRE-family HTH domain